MSNSTTVKLVFGGDFAPSGRYETLISEKSGQIFESVRNLIVEADFALFNLEVPICEARKSISKVGPALRAGPETLLALTANSVAAVCLANNHILDYGLEGLSQTLAALQSVGISHVGAGLDRKTAEAPLQLVLKGKRISIFSFAEQEFNVSDDGQAGAALLDPLRIAPLLLAERDLADAIVVCVHGGNEYFPWPRPGLRRLCQFLIEIGADAVICHHPHVPGPYEVYRGKPIFYSLGNLIFDSVRPPPEWDLGYLAQLDIIFDTNGITSVRPELIPYRQSVDQGGLRKLDTYESSLFLDRIKSMRDALEVRPDDWLEKWHAFVRGKAAQTVIDLSSPVRFPGLRRLLALRPLFNLIAPQSRSLHRLNLLRCDSHRELIIAAMEARKLPASLSSRPVGSTDADSV